MESGHTDSERSAGFSCGADLGRREFLRAGVAAALGGPLATLLSATGCERRETTGKLPAAGDRTPPALAGAAPPGDPAREVRLVAEVGEVEVGPGQVYRTWLYNGAFPGPEIRAHAGERLRVTLENRLPEATTIHWHGVPVPNAMDGVPGVTQAPVDPGGTFVYEFAADPAGSYMYHTHLGLQLDRGLFGPLIFEEREPHVPYDREYTVVLDDFLPEEPRPIAGRDEGGMMGGMMRGMMGRNGGHMRIGPGTPAYPALLVNGRPTTDPPAFAVSRGERVRLRLVNLAGATTFRVALAGHRLTVTHADARPVRPVAVDSLVLGMGERYDVLVEADNPGAWTLAAASLDAGVEPARAIVRYAGASRSRPPAGETPDGLRAGRVLALDDLESADPLAASGRPDRTFELMLSGGMRSSAWTIDDQAYPDAEPLEIRRGERVRVQMTNMSMHRHPMHLHGHFFRVGNALKETVIVPPHMGRVSFQFLANNPGDWFFHCHHLYHMESGMARVFRYT